MMLFSHISYSYDLLYRLYKVTHDIQSYTELCTVTQVIHTLSIDGDVGLLCNCITGQNFLKNTGAYSTKFKLKSNIRPGPVMQPLYNCGRTVHNCATNILISITEYRIPSISRRATT